MNLETLSEIFFELLRRASTTLPRDVVAALEACRENEAPNSRAASVLQAICDNHALAAQQQTPLCQDTGAPAFFFTIPKAAGGRRELSTAFENLQAAAWRAARLATQKGLLRQNTIDTLTGAPMPDAPACHFEPGGESTLEARLLLKGGGSENVSRQYALPDETLGADRDLCGARACVLDAVWRAQGLGCAPGVLGVCVGGDRAGGWLCAKRQLLRPLDDVSREPALAEFERGVLRGANALGIGPMGLGGNATLLGVKAAALPRVPASYFVTVAYSCWAVRRAGASIAPDGRVIEWRE